MIGVTYMLLFYKKIATLHSRTSSLAVFPLFTAHIVCTPHVINLEKDFSMSLLAFRQPFDQALAIVGLPYAVWLTPQISRTEAPHFVSWYFPY